MDTYQQRVVAYADILGWRAACYDLSKYSILEAAAKAIADYARNFTPQAKSALTAAHGVPKGIIEQHGGVQFSFFSDNFAVSAPATQAESVFKIVAFASHELLRKKFLVRGGVALGYLHHDHELLFGPALVEAVDLEKGANYPRLLCSDGLIDFLDQTSYKEKVVISDEEQKWVVNIALGSPYALADLSAILDDGLITLKKFADKWSYLRKILPRMYQAKGTSA